MGVLLLNATYEPLRVINFRRAVALVLQKKAEIVEAHDEVVVSAGDPIMDKPDVIRLNYYVKIPFKAQVPLNNRAVLNRDRFTCAYCGQRATTVDHVQPRAKNGAHDWTNVVAACRKCNAFKADKVLGEGVDKWGDKKLDWKLPFKPQPPEARTWIVLAQKPRESWEQWLERTPA